MNPPSIVVLMLFCAVFSFGYQPARAAAPLAKVMMTTGSINERERAVYVAQERGFFRKYGVDVVVQVRNGAVGMAALSSGEHSFTGDRCQGPILGRLRREPISSFSPVSSKDRPACSSPVQK